MCDPGLRLRVPVLAPIFGAVEEREQRERIAKYEAELGRLERQLVDLDARRERIPRLGFFAILALPAWYLWGFAWGVVTVVLTLCLIATAAYLLRTRREDNERDIADVRRDLARFTG